MPDTPYTVSVLPVYPAREGKRQSENGRTCKCFFFSLKSGLLLHEDSPATFCFQCL